MGLPVAWDTKKLKDICNNISTNNKRIKQKNYEENAELPVIDQGEDLIGGYTSKAKSKVECILPAIIFGDHTKAVKYVNFDFAPGADGIKVLEPNIEEVQPKFLFYLLKRMVFEIPDKGYARHFQFLNKESYPVPPLPTQHRIVEKIEELFSELDHGVESLKKAQKQLKTYRQAVLKDAFEGKLTKKWRERQTGLPTPEELMQQIKAERKAHRECQLAEWEKEVEQWEKDGKNGKKPSKPRKSRSVNKLTDDKLSELHHLPENWYWGKINDITLRVEYGTSNKSLDEGDIPVLRMGNMQNGKIDWDDLKYSNDPKDNEEYLLEEGDVLFNRTNSPELVGKAVIYKGERPAIFAGYLIRLNQIKEVVNSDYLNYFLNSVTAKNHGNKVKTDGVNQSNINGTKLVNYPFPICSKKEQDKIVQNIELRFSVIDQLEQTIRENLQKAEALRQSILKKAFSGELVEEEILN